MTDETTLEHDLEYRVAVCQRWHRTEWWLISPATGQAFGPYLDPNNAHDTAAVLNAARLAAAHRKAAGYDS